MKTFETEKNNIPEGATHYMDQTSYTYFAWGKFVGEDLHLMLASESEWTSVSSGIFSSDLKPIPKPEVVGWKNGDECLVKGNKAIWIGNDWMDDTQCIVAKYKEGCGYVDLVFAANEFISKPESPEEKEQREELEAAYDLYCHVSNKANRGTYTFEQFCDESLTDYKIDYLAIVDKTNYRKGE